MTDSGLNVTEREERKKRRWALEGKARAQPCPDCGAGPGEVCVANGLGEPAASMHKVRIRLASYRPVTS